MPALCGLALWEVVVATIAPVHGVQDHTSDRDFGPWSVKTELWKPDTHVRGREQGLCARPAHHHLA